MHARIFIFALAFLSFATGCDNVKGPFRTTSDIDLCAQPHALTAANWEVGANQPAAKHQRCPFQTHVLPESMSLVELIKGDMTVSGNDWAELATSAGQHIATPGQYHLAFVELAANGDLAVDGQLQALKTHLGGANRARRQDLVVVYVHGWRHDADLRNTDVKKFRRLLGYSRAALNTRCITEASYCNATLTGVFVGWPGRNFDEGPVDEKENINRDKGFTLGLLGAAGQFWRRWDISCYLGSGRKACLKQDKVTDRPSPLREVLEAIQAQLVLRAGDPTSDKMLIVGHSMGGNMLAKMMLDIVPPKIKRHAPGQAMRPPVGDLVVLLNPASDAASWTTLQAAERARAGFAPRENAISCNNQPDCPERANIIRWRKLYPIQQRPVYISLTSASDWGTLKNAGRKVEFDTATSQIFPFARSLGGYGGERNLTAIGHLLPKFDKDNTLLGLPEGTSHEVVVLQGAVTPDGARYASTYGNAAHPARAWCAPAHGWLRAARAPDQPGYLPQQNWDYGYRANPPEGQTKYLKNLGGPLNEASIQWRQGLYTRANLNALSVSPGTTPFWNVRALDSAIRGHAGWASYPIWCALNQMVLDDITAPGPSQP